MPNIDVTSVLLDPVVAGEAFVVIRRAENVNQYGEPIVGMVRLPAYGSIFPAGANSLVREEAYDAQAKSVTVVTTFRLRGVSKDASGQNYKPDIVLWRGDKFTVRDVKDFSKYGVGMIAADCTSVDLEDQPPLAEAPPPGKLGQLDYTQPGQSGWI